MPARCCEEARPRKTAAEGRRVARRALTYWIESHISLIELNKVIEWSVFWEFCSQFSNEVRRKLEGCFEWNFVSKVFCLRYWNCGFILAFFFISHFNCNKGKQITTNLIYWSFLLYTLPQHPNSELPTRELTLIRVDYIISSYSCKS